MASSGPNVRWTAAGDRAHTGTGLLAHQPIEGQRGVSYELGRPRSAPSLRTSPSRAQDKPVRLSATGTGRPEFEAQPKANNGTNNVANLAKLTHEQTTEQICRPANSLVSQQLIQPLAARPHQAAGSNYTLVWRPPTLELVTHWISLDERAQSNRSDDWPTEWPLIDLADDRIEWGPLCRVVGERDTNGL